MTKDPLVYIDDILKSISRIEEYTDNVNRTSFLDDPEKQDAVIRRFEIIGEAVKNLPGEVRKQHINIPWKRIAGMRNVLIHEYSGVNEERVWKVIEQDLPQLQRDIQQVKNNLESTV